MIDVSIEFRSERIALRFEKYLEVRLGSRVCQPPLHGELTEIETAVGEIPT